MPIAADFATIGSVFANHEADLASSGRGGDLYLRYPDGTLRNLTVEAGFGDTGRQGANAIAVRDPAVHWDGTRAVFSMAIGAPTRQFEVRSYYFQLYEVSGLAPGETARITRIANQPENFNNVQPTYDSRGRIVFVSDRPRNGARHLYPQHDEYESTATPTGLWRLDPSTGELVLLQHSPSGSFNPSVDSYGRVVFTRWDHLQRDQQNDLATDEYGTFNYSDESAQATATADRSEVFPEPRIAAAGSNLNGHRINHFFPWQLNQDGTEEETLNHVGRHELQGYFDRSVNDDANLDEFIAEISGRANPNPVLNLLQLREDPARPGRYYAVDAPEFNTHAAGQLLRFDAPPSLNPAQIRIEYLTHRDSFGTTPSPNHSGHFRNPLPLADGRLLAAHADAQGDAGNLGTRAQPNPSYQFRLREVTGSPGSMQAGAALVESGIRKSISYYDPDVLVSYDGPLWELSPVEVRARPVPPDTSLTTAAPEQQAYALEGVDATRFRAWLVQQGLAVLVMRNVTTRDLADQQQPYNLRVPGGAQTTGSAGKLYDIAHMQFFQGDQLRGIGGRTSPRPGRRVIAQVLHEQNALALNPPGANGPAGSVAIFPDGSVAAYVPTRRALSWQSTAPDGSAVVRERYWLTFQPGEVRACDGCHGVNQLNQAGQGPAQNVALAFRDLLARWKATAPLFRDGFEAH